jgi:hypothetical protein
VTNDISKPCRASEAKADWKAFCRVGAAVSISSLPVAFLVFVATVPEDLTDQQ